MRPAIVLLLSAILIPRVCLGAETPELSKGVRVRVSAPSVRASRLTGVLVDVTPEHIRIAPDQGSAAMEILRKDLGQIEVSTGHRRHTLVGAGLGLVVGACTGAAIGAQMEPGMAGVSGNVVVGAGLIGTIGLAVGTIVGTLFRTETWTPLSSNTKPVEPGPGGGVAGGVAGFLTAG
jgi:hypothetical protein